MQTISFLLFRLSLYPQPPPPDTPRIRIRIRMKIFARITIRKKKCGSETLTFCKTNEKFEKLPCQNTH